MSRKYRARATFSLELLAEEREPRPPTEEAAWSDHPHPSIPASFSPISCLMARLSLQAQRAPQPAPGWGLRDPRTPVVSSQAWARTAAVRRARTRGGHRARRPSPPSTRGSGHGSTHGSLAPCGPPATVSGPTLGRSHLSFTHQNQNVRATGGRASAF